MITKRVEVDGEMAAMHEVATEAEAAQTGPPAIEGITSWVEYATTRAGFLGTIPIAAAWYVSRILGRQVDKNTYIDYVHN